MIIITSETDSKISVLNKIKSFRRIVVKKNFTSVVEFGFFAIRRPFLDTMLSFNQTFSREKDLSLIVHKIASFLRLFTLLLSFFEQVLLQKHPLIASFDTQQLRETFLALPRCNCKWPSSPTFFYLYERTQLATVIFLT